MSFINRLRFRSASASNIKKVEPALANAAPQAKPKGPPLPRQIPRAPKPAPKQPANQKITPRVSPHKEIRVEKKQNTESYESESGSISPDDQLPQNYFSAHNNETSACLAAK